MRTEEFDRGRRREQLFVLLLLILSTTGVRAEDPGKLELTVKETAGIRRFGYPVHATLELPREAAGGDRFRLLTGGKVVPAQFFRLSAAGRKRSVAVDFIADMAPLGGRTYTVEFGPKVEPGPAPGGGMKLEEGKEAFTVRSGGMAYVAPRDLKGLLKEVRDGKKEYTRAGPSGLFLLAGKKEHPVGGRGFKGRVVRRGPLAASLHFEGETALGGGKKAAASVVEMTFPRSKSWVEVDWRVRQVEGVDGLAVNLSLLVEGTPTLVDFGAGSLVYTTLKRGESALLRGAPRPGLRNHPWEVLTGDKDGLVPFVVPGEGKAGPAEGWAHLMDRRRCTAVAMGRFGIASRDEIRLDADGRLRLRRLFGKGVGGVLSLHFWLHFVDTPVQVGALTSPQSMLAPLSVEVKAPK
jgi:hypothetical protein